MLEHGSGSTLRDAFAEEDVQDIDIVPPRVIAACTSLEALTYGGPGFLEGQGAGGLPFSNQPGDNVCQGCLHATDGVGPRRRPAWGHRWAAKLLCEPAT